MAKEAEERGLPPQLPLMASLVESGMKNIQGGHADSVGFFQMRVGIWNQGDYAGYPDKPELQVKWFLDQAERSRSTASPPASRSTTPTPSANGSPTSNAPPSNTAAATSSSSTKPTSSSASPPRPRPPPRPRRRAGRGRPGGAADAPKQHRGDDDAVHGRQGRGGAGGGAQARRDRAVHEGDRPEAGERRGRPGGARRRRGRAAAAPATGPTAAEDAAANQAVGAPVPAGELALQEVGPIGTYPGDKASQAELAKWLASEAKKAGLPPELPVMASLVESGVKNLKGGDADSAGFFQMRVGIWDSGPYKGYRTTRSCRRSGSSTTRSRSSSSGSPRASR